MDSLINGLSSTYDLTASTAATNSITSKIQSDYSSSTDEELMEACKEFESYFVEQVLNKMQEAMLTEDDENSGSIGQIKSLATESLMTEYASMISDAGSLGLADKLYEQMKRNYNL